MQASRDHASIVFTTGNCFEGQSYNRSQEDVGQFNEDYVH